MADPAGVVTGPPELSSRFKTGRVKEDREDRRTRGVPSDRTGQTTVCGMSRTPLPMELRTNTSHKENVPPRPAAPLRPDRRRFLESLSVGLGSGHGPWAAPWGAERRGPAASPSPGAVLPVQTTLASPGPGPALTDTTSSLAASSFLQQSNLQPQAGRPPGRVRDFPVQQSNLSTSGPSLAECGSRRGPHLWPGPRENFAPHMLCLRSPLHRRPLARLSPSPCWLPAAGTPCPDVRPAAGFGSLEGCPRPGPRSWGGPASRTRGPVGKSLSLEDLAVPAPSRPRTPSRAAIHQLLVSVQRLEDQVARLGRRAHWKLPGPARRLPRHHCSQALPVRPQPSPPVLASFGARKRPPSSPRDPTESPETSWVWAGASDSVADGEPVLSEVTSGLLPGEPLGPERGVLPTQPLSQGESCSAGPLCVGVQRRRPRLPGAAWGVLPGQDGGKGSLQGEKTASCAPAADPMQSKARDIVTLETETACQQLLSRCFRAWWHLAQRLRAVMAAEALRRRHLLRTGLWVLRGAQRLREARLEAAQGRRTKALLAWSFREWKHLAAQRKQGQPHIQAGPERPASGGGRDQGHPGRKAEADPAQRPRLGSLRLEEEGAWQLPGQRPDGGNSRGGIPQTLQQLAVFLLWCHQKGWAGQERGLPEEAAQAPARAPQVARHPQARPIQPADIARGALLGTWCQRAWLCRCFTAWRQFVQRRARCRDHFANLRLGNLRTCLQQWVRMKQLRDSETMALLSSALGMATAHSPRLVAQGLPPGRGWGSLQEACRRLALCRALLLWRTRLSQCQQADTFFQGIRRRTLRRALMRWHWRTWPLGAPSGHTRTTSVPAPVGSTPEREASLAGSTPRGSQQRAPRDPTVLENLQVTFLQAARRRRQGQCLLLWQARAQQWRGAARCCQRTLQRRVLLSWSHWAAAQGARRQLAACWAWGRSCRAALGVWRQRLAQRQEEGQWVRERSWALARGSLRHWHSRWQRQQALRERYQLWAQRRLQGLRRTTFQSWQRAAAVRGRRAAWQERLLLRRALDVWAQAVTRSHFQVQLQQSGCRRLLRTHWSQWQAALFQVRLELQPRAEEAAEAAGLGTVCPGAGDDLRHRPSLATRGRPLLLMATPAPWKEPGSCWTQATGLVPQEPRQLHSPSRQRKQQETFCAQSDRKQDFRLSPGPYGPPLYHTFQLWLQWPVHCDWARGPSLWTRPGKGCSSETRALQGRDEAQLRQLGRKYLQRWHLEILLRRVQGPRQARLLAATWQHWADAQEMEQLARTLLRQWHLERAWSTWRRRTLQLRVAQRMLQQEDGRVLSQAFEKWHQCLTARGLRTGGTSCPRPQSKLGTKGPGSGPEDI
ncbi:uncharacterized protein C1orf167 homolog isoform X2 [Tamandua tetradactyla]|uniref:uncharacterized protein C1orf167 homolog isoform X2 n=1 Tax=Tamandua tetradactyla TaxID=48850 RepID=UPI0040547CC2